MEENNYPTENEENNKPIENYDFAEELEKSEEPEETEEIGIVDKIIGVFSSPGKTFDSISLHKPRQSDWLFPVVLLIIVQIVSSFLLMGNPKILAEASAMQMKMVEQSLNEAVESGKMTKEQAATQYSTMNDNIEKQMDSTKIFQWIGIAIFGFLSFFFFTTIYFLLARYALRGIGGYQQAMSACGLTLYIIALQSIVAIIISLGSESLMNTNLASITGADLMSFNGFLFAKLDPFKIWYYVVLSIALANMFQARNTVKYIIAIFVLWLGSSFAFYYLGQAVPALRWLSMG